MSWFCKIGIHEWGAWEVYMIDVVSHAPTQYRRRCTYCGKRQYGKAESKIKLTRNPF